MTKVTGTESQYLKDKDGKQQLLLAQLYFRPSQLLSFCHSVLCIQYGDFSPCPPPPELFFRTELNIYLLCFCSCSTLSFSCPLWKHECTFPRDCILLLFCPQRKRKLGQSDAKTSGSIEVEGFVFA